MARQRLSELPEASRQLAMQRFNPGPEVPESDFPKLFVAFLKRFKTSKDGADEDEGGSRSPASPSRRRTKETAPTNRPGGKGSGKSPKAETESASSEDIGGEFAFFPALDPRRAASMVTWFRRS